MTLDPRAWLGRLSRAFWPVDPMEWASRQTLHCVGHSHLTAVQAAAAAEGQPIDEARVFLNRQEASSPEGRAVIEGVLARAPEGQPVFSLMGGGYHIFIALFRQPRAFDFYLEGEPFEEGAEVIPLEAIRAALETVAADYLPALELIAPLARGPVWHFQSPPAFANNEIMARDMNKVPNAHGVVFDAASVQTPVIRRKIWRVYSDLMRERCAALGVHFVACPAEAMTADGFLKPEYYGDPNHGNQAYGALVLHEMRAILSQHAPKARRRA